MVGALRSPTQDGWLGGSRADVHVHLFVCLFVSFPPSFPTAFHLWSRWVKLLDPTSGYPYYYNPATGVSQWEQPEGWEGPGGPAAPSSAPVQQQSAAPESGWLTASLLCNFPLGSRIL